MPKIIKPGKLLKTHRNQITNFQHAESLQTDGKLGRQMWTYMLTLIDELRDQIAALRKENDELMNGIEPARKDGFLPGLTVGLIAAFLVWAIAAG